MPEASPPLSMLRRLAHVMPYFRDSRWALVVAAVASVIGAATEPVVPALMQPLLDKGFQAGALPLWTIPPVIVGLFALRGAAGFVAQYALSWASQRSVVALRDAMFGRLLDATPALFAGSSASALTNTLVYEVQTGAFYIVNSILSFVKDALTLVALLCYLLWLNWQLTLMVGVLFPVVALTMRALTRRLHGLTVAGQAATDELAYVVEENVLAWRIVRMNGAGAAQARRFSQASRQLSRLSLKSVVASAAMTPLTQVLSAIALSSVLVVALWQSRAAGASIGAFVAFITAMLMLIAPIKRVSEVAGFITRGLVAFERALALVTDTPVECGGSHDPGRARGTLALRGVHLRYRDDQPAALANLDLDIAAGESVALVGPSGAGKTSLINLLPRFVEPTGGEVLLDGVALPQWNVDALRRQFALVSQDVVLFNDSIAANVGLGRDVDRDRVEKALRDANLADFVAGLPGGIDHRIGHNGSQLSGGQRQRLAIARAIYQDAPVLILDEATSALDSESERLVQQALGRLMQGRTSIVIAHRLSTIESADRIVAMEGGRVIEQGSHAELLLHGGLYAKLHALQFRS
jgi:ATP-binding cassette, subfamily B, bacterial MsbA